MAVITLIVMEPGAEWPGHVGDSQDVVAVGEQGEALLERSRQKLEAMRQRRQSVRVAVLACNDAMDPDSVARRAELAFELLTAVAGAGFGRLVLTASGDVPMRQRRALLALAGALSQRIRGMTATVSVRFGESDRREIGLADGIGAEVLTHVLRDHGCVQSG